MVRRILDRAGVTLAEIIGDERSLRSLKPADFADDKFGVPTVTDILAELEKPGRDPRPRSPPRRSRRALKVADLKAGMILEGVVTNVAAFGAFVDVGVHQDGLVHVSAMSDRFVSDPHEVVRSGQVVRVKVVDVDVERQRIGLSLRLGDEQRGERGKPARDTRAAPVVEAAAAVSSEITTAARDPGDASPVPPPVRWPRPCATPASGDRRRAGAGSVLLANQPAQRLAIRCQEFVDAWLVDVGHDDLADLLVDVAEDAVRLHLLGLIDVVLGGRHVVHDLGLEPVDQPEVDQIHEALLTHLLRERVLVADRQDVAPMPVLDRVDDDVGQRILALAEDLRSSTSDPARRGRSWTRSVSPSL